LPLLLGLRLEAREEGRSERGGVGGRVVSRTPKVGQRGSTVSGRSNSATGKFDSSPPSTQVAVPPEVGWRTGRKKNGMALLARTARATG